MSRRLTPVIIFVLLLGAQGLFGQDQTQTVVPTEDDLQEALELGEIDFSQYQLLLEYALLGVSPPETYLLDLFPHLGYYWLGGDSTLPLSLDVNESTPSSSGKNRKSGRFRHTTSKELETDGRSRYRTSLRFTPLPGWEIDIRAAREFTGRERLIYRNATYQSGTGLVRAVTVGNYAERLGMGTIFGYRGKVLSFASELCNESLLYPDYGGANGLLLHSSVSGWESVLAFSQQRDCGHTIQSGALQLQPKYKHLPAVILGLTAVQNRQTERTLRDYKLGLYREVRQGRNRMAIETAVQGGYARSFAAVLEGRYLANEMIITFAGWAYGNRFETVTSGGRSGAVSRSNWLEEIDLSFSDRRAGQEGGYVRTVSGFTSRWSLENLASYAGFDRTDYRLQWSPAIVYTINRSLSVRGDFETTLRRTTTAPTAHPVQYSRGRLELRIKSDNWSARSYIATTKPVSGGGYLSARLQLSVQSADRGKIDAWLAMDRIDKDRINYWYGYLRHRCRLFESVEVGAKLSHRFNRAAGNSHYTALTLEATALF